MALIRELSEKDLSLSENASFSFISFLCVPACLPLGISHDASYLRFLLLTFLFLSRDYRSRAFGFPR